MDKDRVEAAARRARASVKEAIGKVTGDPRVEREGAAEQKQLKASEGKKERP